MFGSKKNKDYEERIAKLETDNARLTQAVEQVLRELGSLQKVRMKSNDEPNEDKVKNPEKPLEFGPRHTFGRSE